MIKSATLSTTLACPAFTELQLDAAPILRVALEPKHACTCCVDDLTLTDYSMCVYCYYYYC